MAKDRIPTSRISRTARVTGLAAGQAARQLGTATTNLARGEEGKQKALERRHIEAAEQIVSALGTMKGAAMKLGQVMSFLDVGLVPEEYREEFQRKLGELRDAAPKVRFNDMRKVIESELGESLKDAFAEFDETPIAAASIGQVYRARLHDGRDVAVKVQYPGVAQAVRADMQNLGMILRLMKRVAPGLDVKATAEEVRSRIGDELDYELEAQNQRSMARIFRGHPFIVVPDVVTSLTREKVIVSEFVSGLGFDAVKQLDQATRDRVGEIVFRFYFGCMYRHHQFSGDPHPGNFLLMDDGKVAFLDFGLFKVMPKELLEIELACQRAGHEQDGAELKRIWAETGFLKHPENFREDKLLAQFLDATWWYVLDEDIELAARDRHPGDDRDVRPALVALRPDAPRDAARRPPVRPPRRDAHARGALAAARARQLPPHRARVDLRRRARHRARPPGGRVLRPRAPVTDAEAFWEDFYAGGKSRWSGKPNASLVEEVADLEPGTALDLGCGQGGDAIWLASQGWTVTATDISQTALDVAAQHAAEAGVSVDLGAPRLRGLAPRRPVRPRHRELPALGRRAAARPHPPRRGRPGRRRRHACWSSATSRHRSTTTTPTSRAWTRSSPSSRCPRIAGSCRRASCASGSTRSRARRRRRGSTASCALRRR